MNVYQAFFVLVFLTWVSIFLAKTTRQQLMYNRARMWWLVSGFFFAQMTVTAAAVLGIIFFQIWENFCPAETACGLSPETGGLLVTVAYAILLLAAGVRLIIKGKVFSRV